MQRDKPSMRANACSAVLTVLPVGVFITMMPCRVAAVLSMLSVPTPVRHDRFQTFIAVECVGGDLDAAATDRSVELRQRVAQVFSFEARADLVFDLRRSVQEVQAFLC